MRRLSTVIALLVSAGNAHACLYDTDVDYDLTHGLPNVASILAGKWERHSDAYFDSIFRVQSERAANVRIVGTTFDLPDGRLLAGTYIRRGNYEQVPKLLDESGRYFMESTATYSSRATAQLALGDFEAASADLLKAMQLTRGNLFDRERYELQLVNYLRAIHSDSSLGITEPTFARALIRGDVNPGATTLPNAAKSDETLFAVPRVNKQINDAVTAIIAMIRFGNPQSAQLYAALGDLLRARGDYDLAYRAFRRALENRHPYPQVIQAQLDAVRKQVNDDSLISDSVIDAERREADRWVEAFRTREAELLKAGENAGLLKNYAEFYKANGNLRTVDPDLPAIIATQSARFWKPLVLLAGIFVVFVLMLVRWFRERRSQVASA